LKNVDALRRSRVSPETKSKFNKFVESFDGAKLRGFDLRPLDSLSGSFFRGANLSHVNLQNSRLDTADFYDADMYNINLSGASLQGVKFQGADLWEANLREANLKRIIMVSENDQTYTTDFTNANLMNANLKEARLHYAKLKNTRLLRANLENSELINADLRNANLERANLTRADLFRADLGGAEFYAAVTTDTQISEDTEFGDHYVSDQNVVPHKESQKARWCARTIEQAAEDNALTDTAREAFITRKRLKRSEAREESEWGRWIHLTVSGLLMGYGESIKRVLVSAAIVIVTATFLYPWVGVRPTGENSAKLTYPALTLDSSIQFAAELVDTVLTAGYFSVLTFTTLGFGDLRPVGFGRVIATVEAGFGVTLFALFVFVLGRRATR
jgi:uncharacterized protein YjbI with pentapeptide repeats